MMHSTEPEAELVLSPQKVETITRAIADPRRFSMLQQIAKEPSLACAGLSMQECLSPATISHHIKELQSAGLLDIAREGRGLRLTFRRTVWQAYLRQLGGI